MAARARALRPESTSPNTKLGFHIPPFSSVAHLHLHVLVPPFTKFGSVQYPVREREDGGKKWTWFVTPEQVVAILGNGSGEGIGLGSAPGKRT
jgi:hypothetical protein